MAVSGGGPSLPMTGEFGPFMAVLALLMIVLLLWLAMKFEF